MRHGSKNSAAVESHCEGDARDTYKMDGWYQSSGC